MTLLLLAASIGNGIYLLTRVRVYRLNKRSEPVSSPNARFVSSDIDVDMQQQYTLVERGSALVLGFIRKLCGSRSSGEGASTRRTSVQQIDMWNPGERPMHLFCIYSPAHCLLWMATGSTNWMIMLIVMGLIWAQVRCSLSRDLEANIALVDHLREYVHLPCQGQRNHCRRGHV